MTSLALKKAIHWVLALYIAFVFLQSLFFKFSGSEETVIIFTTIASWMAVNGAPQGFVQFFRDYGGMATGVAELTASLLVLVPATRVFGALIGLAVMSGAIFFHLFTPLGIDRVVDAAGNTDGGLLFFMACGVWLSCGALLFMGRRKLLRLIGR